jgi:hypothetical protein
MMNIRDIPLILINLYLAYIDGRTQVLANDVASKLEIPVYFNTLQ